MTSTVRRLVALAGFLIAAAVVPGCEDEPDEKQIRKLIDEAATLAEQHDVGGLADLATEGFVANPGNIDRQKVRGILFMVFKRYRTFDVRYPYPLIEIDGDTASTVVPFLIVRLKKEDPEPPKDGEDGTVQPEAWLDKLTDAVGDPYRLRLEFEKVDGDWLVARSEVQGMRRLEDI